MNAAFLLCVKSSKMRQSQLRAQNENFSPWISPQKKHTMAFLLSWLAFYQRCHLSSSLTEIFIYSLMDHQYIIFCSKSIRIYQIFLLSLQFEVKEQE